ncbi:4'-phosphopantetheinyl transferase superfamily protein [Streptomyces sp. NPDC019443]|uniref:4'-phosphopantetheinyl transferase superfamily protein n=1 Tax=Streptomyces sp. NPDC019443 TaxID=3365061 RepID=UPI0037B01547
MGELLHGTERAEPAALPPSARPAAVGRCWARKEAYLKGVGIGLGEDPSVTYVGTGGPSRGRSWLVGHGRAGLSGLRGGLCDPYGERP